MLLKRERYFFKQLLIKKRLVGLGDCEVKYFNMMELLSVAYLCSIGVVCCIFSNIFRITTNTHFLFWF